MEHSQIQAIPLIAKPDKDITKKENHRPLYVIYKECTNTLQNASKPSSTVYKKDHTPWPRGISSRDANLTQYMIHHTGKIMWIKKDKNHMNMSIDTDKAKNSTSTHD